MLPVFLGEVCSLLIVAPLSAHGYGRVQVKLEVSWRFDELFQLVDVLELCVAIEQKGGVVRRRLVMLVELLQILDEVVYPLCVQELPDDL